MLSAKFLGRGSEQPVVLVLVDSYTPCLSHKFHFFDHLGELQWNCGQTTLKGCKMIHLFVEIEPQIHSGTVIYGDMEVCVTEVQ